MNGRPSLPFLLVAGLAVIGVVGAIIAGVAAGDDFQPPAYTVNGHSVSQSTVNDQLDALAHSKIAKSQPGAISASNGSVTADIAAQVVTLDVHHDVIMHELKHRGVTTQASDRRSARTQLNDGLPASVRDPQLELLAGVAALKRHGTSTASLNRTFRRAHVTVDAKYGTWRPRRGEVCAPTGCARS